MDQPTDVRPDVALQQPATARLIVQYLADFPAGMRIEEIAYRTGSRYRWVEATIRRLTRASVLERVGPNCYALKSTEGSKATTETTVQA